MVCEFDIGMKRTKKKQSTAYAVKVAVKRFVIMAILWFCHLTKIFGKPECQ
jgi:hypothetical protein